MWAYAKTQQLGKVLAAETGFILVRDPDTVRGADIAFVHKDRIPVSGIPKKFVPFAPDVAVEVVPPSDRMEAVEEKVGEWLATGTRLVWVVLPRQRQIKVYRSPTEVTILTDKDELDGADVMPGFRLPVAQLFQ
jgi:Uma2 family endonuclease